MNLTSTVIGPAENADVNKHWMCDAGMLDYARIHEGRVLEPQIDGESVPRRAGLDRAVALLRDVRGGKLAIVLGAQFSLEDNAALLALGKQLNCSAYFESGLPPGPSDTVLMHADKNPNSAGVRRLLGPELRPLDQLISGLQSRQLTHVLSLGATLKDANLAAEYGQLPAHVRVVLCTHAGPLVAGARVVLPVCSWAETEGTFVNVAGLAQVSDQAIMPQGLSLPGWKWVSHLALALGHELSMASIDDARSLIDSPAGANRPGAPAQTESQP